MHLEECTARDRQHEWKRSTPAGEQDQWEERTQTRAPSHQLGTSVTVLNLHEHHFSDLQNERGDNLMAYKDLSERVNTKGPSMPGIQQALNGQLS